MRQERLSPASGRSVGGSLRRAANRRDDPGGPRAAVVAGSGTWSWSIRVVMWSAILAVPCWLSSASYERGLAAVIKGVVDLAGHSLSISRLEVFAPFDIGIFVSMCLASRRALLRRRVRALVLGIPLLAILEVVVMVGATFVMISNQHGALAGDFFGDLAGRWVKTIGWVNPLVLWWGFLARWELPNSGRIVVSKTGRTIFFCRFFS